MSLINQMLKDLESRRTHDDVTRGVISGIGSRQEGNRRRRGLLAGLIVIIVCLGLATGYLLWRDERSPAAATTVQAATPKPTAPSRTVTDNSVVAAKPAVETKPLPVQKQATATEAEQPAAPVISASVKEKPVPETAAEKTMVVSEPKSVYDEPYTDIQSGRMEKRVRPLRPAQIAEQHYQQGYALLQKGDQKGAEEQWQKALAADPANASSREALAALLYSQARRVEAAEQLAKGLDYLPGNSQLALLYARLQIENGDTAGAISTMERALREQEQSPDFYAFLAATYQRQHDYSKSIAAYRKALGSEPRQGVWWMGIAISLEGEGKTAEALTAYSEARDSGILTPKLLEYVEGRIEALQ